MDKYEEFVERISKALTALDSTRVELCEIAKEMSEYQSDYDKNDQMYLHVLEELDTTDTEKMKDFIEKWQNSRGSRRNIKGLMLHVGGVIDAIPYKNYASAVPLLKGGNYYYKTKYEKQ